MRIRARIPGRVIAIEGKDMKKLIVFVACVIPLTAVLSGCSSRSWYEGFRETERRNCYNIENPIERQRCLDRVDGMSYDHYQEERDRDKNR